MGTGVSGMHDDRVAYLKATKNSTLVIDALVLMTMNMGGKDNVADTQTAITGGAKQLASVYGISVAYATKKMGMLPAIGIDNDRIIIDLAGATKRKVPLLFIVLQTSFPRYSRQLCQDQQTCNRFVLELQS